MGIIAVDKSISLDGYIAGPNAGKANPLGDGGEAIFAWMMAPDPTPEESPLSDAWDEQFADAFSGTGAVIMGRKSFDIIDSPDGWVAPGGFAFTWPVLVMTHRPERDETKGKTPFAFIDGDAEATLAAAREVAGDKHIGLHGGSVVQQFLRAGLVDEIHLHVVPVFLGGGVRLFDAIGPDVGGFECVGAEQGDGVTHLHYRVRR